MIKRGLTLVNAKQCTVLPHITASAFINDDEYGLHQDHEKWLEGLAPHAPISQYRHNGTGEDACPERSDRGLPWASLADAHLKQHGPPSAAVVVAVTNGRLDFGTWERIFPGSAGPLRDWLAAPHDLPHIYWSDSDGPQLME
jgi:thiamine phosphate synthase YjbQ (UPF0047 family)